MTNETITLEFDKGTLLLQNYSRDNPLELNGVQWDMRSKMLRAPAYFYRSIAMTLYQQGLPYDDHAKQFAPLNLTFKKQVPLRSYQSEALACWLKVGQQGVVSLPTGAGKTILAMFAIHATQRPTLIHVPTIDLMRQWHSTIQDFFDTPVGLLGGGYHEIEDLTVTTYDSALIHINRIGNRFGMLVFDECHHLPSERFQHIAIASIAPFRLGLSATPERADGRESILYDICGQTCYETNVTELEGRTLAPYDIITVEVELSETERIEYEKARSIYINFIRAERINFGNKDGWSQFLWKSSRSKFGREAFEAYLLQKKLSQASESKTDIVWSLIQKHRDERILIFTQDNEMAYRLGKLFFIPTLTHHTKTKEREDFLKKFRTGEYPVLITSKVLNEGVDVPEASIAIIVSGSGSVREHVQRLGRILRAAPKNVQSFMSLSLKTPANILPTAAENNMPHTSGKFLSYNIKSIKGLN